MEEATEAMLPMDMWFPNTEYGKSIKLGTKCYVEKAVSTLKGILQPEELKWFTEHPQFCHFFHMPQEKNHKTMGMWMLLLRMVKTDTKKEAWFVVNGVPILYSLREHTLLSGLDGREYPPNYKTFGDLKLVTKHFNTEKVTHEAVEKKIKSMRHCKDRLNIAVLYFLSSVIRGMAKAGGEAVEVDLIFRMAVSDLEWCKTFPWGRYSFDDTMKEMFHMVEHFHGEAKKHWCFPSFIVPLEVIMTSNELLFMIYCVSL